MKIAMIGTGYVGLVSGVCFAEFGFDVTCVDKDAGKIARLNQGEVPIYEPGLDNLLSTNVEAGRLHFSTDLGAAVSIADVVFIGVGTPTRSSDGHADLTFVYDVAREIAPHISKYTLVITKSTVPVGTGEKVAEVIWATNRDAPFEVASNPEFLREGSAIEDFTKPNRIIAGVESDKAKQVISDLYRPLQLKNDAPILFTDIATAELIKYASNAFLATKIAFINEIADLCERFGANVQDVSKGMGLDARIGGKFLQPSPGFGGSCFPKDTLALVRMAEAAHMPLTIVESVVHSNNARKSRMTQKIAEAFAGNVKGKTIAVLGLTFKANTDDMRDSASLVIIPELLEAGASIRAYDPKGMDEAKHLLPQAVTYCKNTYHCMEGADALVILTEWNEFGQLDLNRAGAALKQKLLVDLRNLYTPEAMKKAGFTYISIGRKTV